jgi:hypothetical protein
MKVANRSAPDQMLTTNKATTPTAYRVVVITATVVITIATSFAGIRDKGFLTTADTPLPELVRQSTIIAYATANTNHLPDITLTVTDIWKGTNIAQADNIKVGSHYPFHWPADGGPVMDGAILFIGGVNDPYSPARLRSTYVVHNGRIGNMTTNEFRTKSQLQ